VIKVISFRVPYKSGSSPTVFWLGAGTISLSCSLYMWLMMLGRQTDIHTAESLVSESSAFEVEMAIEKLKRH
jgi:putative effector of murein hydrolase